MSPTEMRAEIFRVARLCAPCLDSMGPATFHGNPAAVPELIQEPAAVQEPEPIQEPVAKYKTIKGIKYLAKQNALFLVGPGGGAVGDRVALLSKDENGRTKVEWLNGGKKSVTT